MDSFFTIGATHRVCEDYAAHGVRKKPLEPIPVKPYVVISDGCSGAEDTDFGSRLIARAAQHWIGHNMSDVEFCRSVIATAETYASGLSLHHDCLSATLLTAEVIAGDEEDDFEKAIFTRVMGDGVVAARTNQGSWDIREFVYPSNAPYYLKYELDRANKHQWWKESPFYYERRWEVAKDSPKWAEGEDGVMLEELEVHVDPEEPTFFSQYYKDSYYDLVLVMTDGVESFTRSKETDTTRSIRRIPMLEVLQQLLQFKNTRGEFIQRRCNRAFQRFSELGWTNQDDVSVAGIYLGE